MPIARELSPVQIRRLGEGIWWRARCHVAVAIRAVTSAGRVPVLAAGADAGAAGNLRFVGCEFLGATRSAVSRGQHR